MRVFKKTITPAPKFMLIGQKPGKNFNENNKADFVWSQKFDGIRCVVLPDGKIISRGGFEIPITRKPMASRPLLDCELVVVGKVQTAAKTMHTLFHNPNSLVLRVFDILVPHIPFQDRYMTIKQNFDQWRLSKKDERVQYRLVEKTDPTYFRDMARAYDWEGIVVRRLEAPYAFGARTRADCFKIKQ